MINFIIKSDHVDSDDFFNEKVENIENSFAEDQFNAEDVSNYTDVNDVLQETSNIISNTNINDLRRTKIFSTMDVNDFESNIMNLVNEELWNITDFLLEPSLDVYAEVVESCFCYDITTYNINLIKIMDNYQNVKKFENAVFNSHMEIYNGKDLEWVIRLLKRSSASPLFDIKTNDAFLERLKPLLKARSTL